MQVYHLVRFLIGIFLCITIIVLCNFVTIHLYKYKISVLDVVSSKYKSDKIIIVAVYQPQL